jgi:hypothetical protein
VTITDIDTKKLPTGLLREPIGPNAEGELELKSVGKVEFRLGDDVTNMHTYVLKCTRVWWI